MAKWELREMDGYSVVMRTEGEVWVAMLGAPEKMAEPLRERQVTVLKSAAELVEDANRGVAAAEEDAQVDRALDGAEKELAGRPPAWVAANLVREAILVLAMDRPEDMGESLYGRSVAVLGEAMEQLQCLIRRGREAGDVPPEPLFAEPEGNIG